MQFRQVSLPHPQRSALKRWKQRSRSFPFRSSKRKFPDRVFRRMRSCSISSSTASWTWNSLTIAAVWSTVLSMRSICLTIGWSLHSTTKKAQKQSHSPKLMKFSVRIYHYSLHQKTGDTERCLLFFYVVWGLSKIYVKESPQGILLHQSIGLMREGFKSFTRTKKTGDTEKATTRTEVFNM